MAAYLLDILIYTKGAPQSIGALRAADHKLVVYTNPHGPTFLYTGELHKEYARGEHKEGPTTLIRKVWSRGE